MKTLQLSLTLFLLTVTSFAQIDARKSLDEIRALDGAWAGKASSGAPVKVDFREAAGGSAVMSEIEGHGNMVSMFHLDNDRLLMTHYCNIGNQPRMAASVSPDGRVLTFNFVDATNLATPDAGHMQQVVFTLIDANHHNEEWTFVDHGKEKRQVFTLARLP
jgi:hypothetical protein